MKRMTSREFVRRVRRLGRQRGVTVRFDAKRGKGSTAVIGLEDGAAGRQLGIDPGDL